MGDEFKRAEYNLARSKADLSKGTTPQKKMKILAGDIEYTYER
jgi:hypothetical protein